MKGDLAVLAAEPVSELNVFNRGTAEGLVETPAGEEHFSPYCTASAPKSLGFTARLLMYEVMHQVAVLGKKITLKWLIVIRTDQCIQLRICLKCLDDAS